MNAMLHDIDGDIMLADTLSNQGKALKDFDVVLANIYSDNSLDSLSSLIMLSHLKVEMVYQCQ